VRAAARAGSPAPASRRRSARSRSRSSGPSKPSRCRTGLTGTRSGRSHSSVAPRASDAGPLALRPAAPAATAAPRPPCRRSQAALAGSPGPLADDPHLRPLPVLVALGVPDAQRHPRRTAPQILMIECRPFRAPQAAGEPEQQQGAVPQAGPSRAPDAAALATRAQRLDCRGGHSGRRPHRPLCVRKMPRSPVVITGSAADHSPLPCGDDQRSPPAPGTARGGPACLGRTLIGVGRANEPTDRLCGAPDQRRSRWRVSNLPAGAPGSRAAADRASGPTREHGMVFQALVRCQATSDL